MKTRTEGLMDIGTIVDGVFPQNSFFGHLYAVFCRAIHGDLFTGRDLDPGATTLNAQRLLCRTVMVLTEFEDLRWVASFHVPMWQSMWKLVRAGGPREAENLPDLIGHLTDGMLVGERLEPNRDIFGSGAINDPYRFRPGLNYHACLHKFLRDTGHELALISLDGDDDGWIERVETTGGQVFYFFKKSINPELP